MLADFCNITNPDLGYRIAKELESFDISILVNNVGMNSGGLGITRSTLRRSLNLVVVNCITPVVMTKIFLEKAKKRKFRSSIIELSSMANIVPLNQSDMYSASKRFNRDFSMSISAKIQSMIDTLILKPGFVSTKLVNNRKIDALTCNVDGCVNSALRVLG